MADSKIGKTPAEETDNEKESLVRSIAENSVVNDDCGESTESSDAEEDLGDIFQNMGWKIKVPRDGQNCTIGTSNGVALPTVEPPCFGDVCVENSTNVHLGSKTFYIGPITIKQYIYANSEINPLSTLKPGTDSYCPHQASDSTMQRVEKKEELGDDEKTDSAHSQIDENASAPIKAHQNINKGVWTNGVRIVGREEWLAQPPDKPLEKMKLPVKYVIISHTVTPSCYTQEDCTKRVRQIQNYHIESNHWADIAYNFLVGGDGLAYVGRSWDYVGAHAHKYNIKSIGISFIGTFNDYVPPKKQLHAAQKLIEEGVKLGKISEDYILLGHRQVSSTLSPGDFLFRTIKTWPHWSPTP